MTARLEVARTTAQPAARRRPQVPWLGIGLVVLVLSILVAIVIGPASVTGPAPITPLDVLGSAWHHVTAWLAERGLPVTVAENPLSLVRDGIIWQGRAPRAVTAVLVGAGLALCGVVLQGATRNPLADPYLLGISSGAALGAVAVLILGVAVPLPVAAFVGAVLALLATLALAGIGGRLTATRAVLAGVAVGQAAAAGVSFIIFSTAQGDSYRDILGWLMGTFGAASWSSVLIALVALVVIGGVLLGFGRTLDAFAFGDTAATALGVNVPRTRWLLLVLSALLTGAMVSVSGSIGFVGLTVPHVVRLLLGPTRSGNTAVARTSAAVGGIFLLWADTVARTVFTPLEVPVGVLTALLGAPVFAFLLLRSRRRGDG
ncbi:iron chelate uptake ABC transporter family permease subunit [Pseudactinotalea terrae]|uniref:iron chelate uptake ABC transporter family permease subunit n=1 Tax=Pseudactinotalea terrae TaxID=1743262 RepID=UPI0012E1E617|nr:iron chelate uptake ABC transporter family permease subunit [Pseudactinotalea terrae]